MLLYALDLFGVAVFAASGALAALAAKFDLLGVLVLASITAVRGGTLRNLLLNRHPIFWIKDSGPLLTVIGATVLTLLWTHFFQVPTNALLIADALGLVHRSENPETVWCSRGQGLTFIGPAEGLGHGPIEEVDEVGDLCLKVIKRGEIAAADNLPRED